MFCFVLFCSINVDRTPLCFHRPTHPTETTLGVLFDYKLGHVRPDVSIFPHSSASSRVVCWLLAHSLLSWPGLVRASFLLATRFLNCGYGFSRKIPFSLINSSDKQLLQLILCCRILRRCVHHIYRTVFHVDMERLPVQHKHLRLYCANLRWHRNLSKV